MNDFVKTVSHMIEDQFPDIYRDEGPEMVEFIKAYYEFLENDPDSFINEGKSALETRDLDETVSKFIVHFKEKYLKDFPFVSATDKRFMIKHIGDYYKSKGTTQGLKLLMLMLYGDEVEVYYPGRDILKPSASEWHRPEYIEVSRSPRIKSYLDKQITGSASGAKAFVDGIVTKRINGKLIDILYLSDVRGRFQNDELVALDDGLLKDAPRVIGSLSDVKIELGGRDNKIGDIFEIESDNGKQGKIRITEVEDATGRVDFKLLNGGTGYTITDQTDIYVSDGVLLLDNAREDFIQFERIRQPIERVNMLSATDFLKEVQNGDRISAYNANNTVVANGIVVDTANTNGDYERIEGNSANGYIYVMTTEGTFMRQDQINFADQIPLDDGSIIEEAFEGIIRFNEANGVFSTGEMVEQWVYTTIEDKQFINSYAQAVITAANATHLEVNEGFGRFHEGYPLYGKSSNATGNVVSSDIQVVGARGQISEIVDANTVVVENIFGEWSVGSVVRAENSYQKTTISNVSVTGANDIRLGDDITANAVIDTTANTFVEGIVVGQNTTAVGVYGNNRPFFVSNTVPLFVQTTREDMISPPLALIADPTLELREPDIVYTIEDEEFTDLSTAGSRTTVFETIVSVPDFDDEELEDASGVLLEIGGRTNGLWMGIRPDKDVYRFRARAGSGNDLSQAAVIDLRYEEIPRGQVKIQLVATSNKSLYLYMNGKKMGSATHTSSTNFGSNPGNFGKAKGDLVSGEPTRPWQGNIYTDLLVWDGVEPDLTETLLIDDIEARVISEVSTGYGAGFKIGSLTNEETVTLNTDMIGANNFADIPYIYVRCDGANSGVGFVNSVDINDGGTGYSNGMVVQFSGGGYANGEPLVPANGIVETDETGSISTITITTPGEGYFDQPVIYIGNTSGTEANVSVNMDYGYGFPKLPDGDLNNFIIDLLTIEDFTIGEISTLTAINPGALYNVDPFVSVYNKYIASYNRGNYQLIIENLDRSFRPGEIVYQEIGPSTFGKGKVTAANTSSVEIERTSFQVAFANNIPVIGQSTGASADVVNVLPIEDQNIMGHNAVISANVIAANGIAVSGEIIDSGYGYEQDDEVNLANPNTPFIISGLADVKYMGVGEGYWRTTDSHLSSTKKIQDSRYYQEFSYDVLSGRSINRFGNVLKKILHVAGTEMFGSVVRTSTIKSKPKPKDSAISIG